jgi:hypothetical protein
MSYITTMAVSDGMVIAADRQITQSAKIQPFGIPENLKGLLPENTLERILDKNSEAVKTINPFSRPLTKPARKLFAIGGSIGLSMGQTMYTEKSFLWICLQAVFAKPTLLTSQKTRQKVF